MSGVTAIAFHLLPVPLAQVRCNVFTALVAHPRFFERNGCCCFCFDDSKLAFIFLQCCVLQPPFLYLSTIMPHTHTTPPVAMSSESNDGAGASCTTA